MKNTLSPSDIAKIEGVHRTTVWHWIQKGHFRNVTKDKRGRYRIPLTSYEEFKKQRKEE